MRSYWILTALKCAIQAMISPVHPKKTLLPIISNGETESREVTKSADGASEEPRAPLLDSLLYRLEFLFLFNSALLLRRITFNYPYQCSASPQTSISWCLHRVSKYPWQFLTHPENHQVCLENFPGDYSIRLGCGSFRMCQMVSWWHFPGAWSLVKGKKHELGRETNFV